MAKYILVKKVKGKKYEYQVIDVDSKAIVSKRTSAREYVACTADGSFYFGRLDLIGKGDHGKRLSHATEILANPEKAYKKQIAYFTPDYRSTWIAENPAGIYRNLGGNDVYALRTQREQRTELLTIKD